MAAQWSTEHVVAEHRDLQANTMAVDSKGQFALLAGRKYLAVVNLDKPTEIVKLLSRQSKWEINTAEWNPHSSHEHLFAIACNQRADVISWSEAGMSTVHALRAHTRVIGDLNWSPFDPNLLATCSVDNYMYIWDIRDARRPINSFFTIAGASQVKWNKVSENILATANEGDVRLWDHRSGTTPLLYLAAHTKKILGLDWSPIQENQLATASQEGTVRFWEISHSRRIENVQTLISTLPVWRARYTPFGEGLITVVVPQLRRGENSLFLWNIGDLHSPIHTFIGHTDVILEFAWRKQNEESKDYQLVTWAKDHFLRIWKIDLQMQKMCGHEIDFLENSDQDIPSASDVPEFVDSYSQVSTEVLKEPETQNITTPPVSPQQTLPDGSKREKHFTVAPKTLQQEFSLVNIDIPNITVEEMDPIKRTCTVLAVSGKNSVTMQMNFPTTYPLNSAPTFQFCRGTTVDSSMKSQIIKALRTTSQQHVKRNRSCLEPCLRQLKTVLDSCSSVEQDVPDAVNQFNLDSGATGFFGAANRYGSFQDVTVPFPRTSGASFCGADYLVCFARPLHLKRLSNPGEVTPRSLSALVAYASNSMHATQSNLMYPSVAHSPSGDGNVSVSSYYYQDRKYRTKKTSKDGSDSHGSEQKLSKAGRVVIYTISSLMPIHKELAQAYHIDLSNIQEMCAKNANAAAAIGRKDLVQLWSIISYTTNPNLNVSSDPDAGFPWPQHPFGRQLLQYLMNHYIKACDIQTVAMMCCIFGVHNEKKTVMRKTSRCIADTAVYTHLTGKWWSKPGGSPYHTIHPGDTNMENWNLGVLLKTSRSNSWSDSLDDHEYRFGINTCMDSQENADRERHDGNVRFLDPKQTHQYDEFKRCYAEILYRWGLLHHRAQILKFVTGATEQHKGVEFLTECRYCHKDVKGAHCFHCKKYSFQCAICHIAVRGASNFCFVCGHGGHAHHMLQWFQEYDHCPVGCGCHCLQESDIFG